MNLNRFQIQVATGRFTLPVVILVCLLLWGMSFEEWSDWASFGIITLVGYLLIETNTTFTLIRTRTTLPVCIYWFLTTSLLFLHSFGWENWIPLAFILSIFNLFKSYESFHATTAIFHTFFFISIGSLVFPPMIYLVPIFFSGMIPFRSLNTKSFWASLMGILTPFWFLFGYAFYTDQMNLFMTPLKKMVQFSPIDFGHIPLNEGVSWGIVSLSLIISSIHYWQVAYTDKTRTRIFFFFLSIIGLCITLFGVLQPSHYRVWIQLQLIPTAYLMGHLFTLTRNKFSGIFFFVTFIVYISLLLLNLWTLFFNL